MAKEKAPAVSQRGSREAIRSILRLPLSISPAALTYGIFLLPSYGLVDPLGSSSGN